MYQQQYQQQQSYQQPAAANNGTAMMIQGRLVWISGNLFTGKLKVDDKGTKIIDEKTGLQVIEYGFGLAIPKVDPRTGQPTALYTQVWNALHAEAYTLYPSGNLPSDFAMKYKDGDGIDHKGQPFNTRDGYAGHFILTCVTQIQPKYFVWSNGNNILVNDGIKCGDYVNVQLNIKAHPAKGRGKAGLYLNPSAVQLIQAGKEIINTPSGDQVFGMNAPAYAGQVVADTGPTMPNMGAPAQYAPPSGQQYPHTNGVPPQSGYQAAPPVADPHYGILPQTHQPPMGNGQQGYAAPTPGQIQPGQPNVGNGYAPSVTSNSPYQGHPQAAPQQAGGMPPLPGAPR